VFESPKQTIVFNGGDGRVQVVLAAVSEWLPAGVFLSIATGQR